MNFDIIFSTIPQILISYFSFFKNQLIKNKIFIILISNLWFNKIPNPVIRFLEINTGNINNIVYVLYNDNKEDHPEEFDKMDKILNLRRDKSYFVSLDKKDIHVRVYQ